ncbi:unnamed protein product, partial [Discosporangium mesarthrocarpum]
PPSKASYIHRVGRTARAGASGTALSLILTGHERQGRVLQRVQASQPPLPVPSLPGDIGGGGGGGGGGRAQDQTIMAAMGAGDMETG